MWEDVVLISIRAFQVKIQELFYLQVFIKYIFSEIVSSRGNETCGPAVILSFSRIFNLSDQSQSSSFASAFFKIWKNSN